MWSQKQNFVPLKLLNTLWLTLDQLYTWWVSRIKSFSDLLMFIVVIICLEHQTEQLMSTFGARIGAKVVNDASQIPSSKDIHVRGIVVHAEYFRESKKNEQILLPFLRKQFSTCFLCYFDPMSSNAPFKRLALFAMGVSMVAHDAQSIIEVFETAVLPAGRGGGSITCPCCNLYGLSESEMVSHFPAFHINAPVSLSPQCPICRTSISIPLQVHLHEDHGVEKSQTRGRPTTQLYIFALVICRHPITHQYLLVHEFAGQGLWCPGGAVDGGENLTEAAVRECIEETGIRVGIKGILGFEYKPAGRGRGRIDFLVRQRVIFYAEPVPEDMEKPPKSIPDFESCGAVYASLEDLRNPSLQLRGSEPKVWAEYLENGGAIYPLCLLREGSECGSL